MEELAYDGYHTYDNVIDPVYVDLKRAANQIKKSQNRVDVVIRELDQFGFRVFFVDEEAQSPINSIKYSYTDNTMNTNSGSKKLILIKDIAYDNLYNDFPTSKSCNDINISRWEDEEKMHLYNKEKRMIIFIYKMGYHIFISLSLLFFILLFSSKFPSSSSLIGAVMSMMAGYGLFYNKNKVENE